MKVLLLLITQLSTTAAADDACMQKKKKRNPQHKHNYGVESGKRTQSVHGLVHLGICILLLKMIRQCC